MRNSKRRIFFTFLLVAIIFLGMTFQVPYYIYKPGNADELEPIVEVVDGYESEGNMRLVTISGLQATPFQYLSAKLTKYNEILPLVEVRPEGVSEEDYMHAQLQMMEGSQESSVVVAYEAAGKELNIEYHGVYVMSVVEGMPAEKKLALGDRIIQIDETKINKAEDLIAYIDTKEANDSVQLKVNRDNHIIKVDIKLKDFGDGNGQIGLGIQLVTDRTVEVDPEVNFKSGKIGGPSAGLMFALEIYNQLTEQDLTNGLEIVGTGALDYDGKVKRIGGIDKKIIAADRIGGDIFFAPYENGANDSNYVVAKKTAEDINSDMIIVPVDTFQDALEYLNGLK